MKRAILIAVVLVLVPTLLFGFGKNKVQYRGFKWSILKSEHFDLFYYEGEEFLAERTVLLAEASYDTLSEYFGHTLSRRIPIMIYKSHSEFQQTNVTLELLGEGVGGFTELYKNRVVLPFTGSYEELRHVMMHELTHVFNFDMLYGGLLQSVFARQYMFSLPLWLIEGMAEFASEYWDAEAEMVMRDAVLNNYYFHLQHDVQGYLAYKQGQAVIRFIAHKYGREKVSDIIQNIAMARNADKGLMASIGTDAAGLSEAWLDHVRKRYYPEVALREEPEDVVTRLTDHRRDDSFINTMPSISPDGQLIVFLSDKSGYDDVYLMSALDGKIIRRLIKGERSQDFESFHYLAASFSWSPDGDRVAVVSKHKDRDHIYLVDPDNGRVRRRIGPDFDTLFRPRYSPEGRKMAFIGSDAGRPGMYLMDLETEEVEALHTGALEYLDYSWSPDGRQIAFTAIAPGAIDSLELFSLVDPTNKPQRDIYLLQVEDGSVERLTQCGSEDLSPVWSPDGSLLLFVSDRNGTYNAYVYAFEDSTTTQISDVLGGVFNPTWSAEGNRIAVSAFQAGGWDIYVVKDPLENLEAIRTQKESDWEYEAPWVGEMREMAAADTLLDAFEPDEDEAEIASVKTMEEYEKVPYRVRFSPDWVSGAFSYNSADGLGGMTRISISDVLGNHRIYIGADFFASFEDIDFVTNYWYLPRRVDYGFGVFHFKNYYYSSRTTMGTPISPKLEDRLFSERNFGGVLALSWPLDKFRRFDIDFTGMRISRDVYKDEGGLISPDLPVEQHQDEDLFIPRLSYTKDTTIWGYTGPIGGSRFTMSIERSIVDGLGSDLSFTTATLDFRKYHMFSRGTQLAGRLFGATSQGSNPAYFYLGGANTLRGYEDYVFEGNNLALASVELRFPFIQQLVTGGPLPLRLGGIRGVMFFDIGGAWTGHFTDLRVAHRVDGGEQLKDLYTGYGFGIRMWFSYFLMRLDFAWATRFDGDVVRRTHFSLGGDF
jgi:Tol biopolymer transport system component